jgi:hypothetical protein
MRKQLLILSVVISFLVIACNGRPDPTVSSSEGTTVGGGSVAHTDSLKPISPAVNGANGNTSRTADTIKPGNSIAFPADSAKQKRP